ncbi:MAG: hydrogenase maturation nickel metallochaperone HypA [Deltaproteobacteria bacterium]|nr:hydrogenase maturation nickel metallochaperone HypA [Deltaproteobacteria bacterium]
MHTVSIARSIVETVKVYAEREGIKKVTKIGLAIGGYSCIEPSSISFCFDIVKKDTIVKDAVLDIKRAAGGDDIKVVYIEGE